MKYLYNKTLAIDEHIKNGHNLITIWEHKFDGNKDMKNITLNEYDLAFGISNRAAHICEKDT